MLVFEADHGFDLCSVYIRSEHHQVWPPFLQGDSSPNNQVSWEERGVRQKKKLLQRCWGAIVGACQWLQNTGNSPYIVRMWCGWPTWWRWLLNATLIDPHHRPWVALVKHQSAHVPLCHWAKSCTPISKCVRCGSVFQGRWAVWWMQACCLWQFHKVCPIGRGCLQRSNHQWSSWSQCAVNGIWGSVQGRSGLEWNTWSLLTSGSAWCPCTFWKIMAQV